MCELNGFLGFLEIAVLRNGSVIRTIYLGVLLWCTMNRPPNLSSRAHLSFSRMIYFYVAAAILSAMQISCTVLPSLITQFGLTARVMDGPGGSIGLLFWDKRGYSAFSDYWCCQKCPTDLHFDTIWCLRSTDKFFDFIP